MLTASRRPAAADRATVAVVNRVLERWPWASLDGAAPTHPPAALPPVEGVAEQEWHVGTAHPAGRFPGPFAADLYVALHALWNAQGRPASGVVQVPTTALLRRMGGGVGGSRYVALRDALEELEGVRIFGRLVLTDKRRRALGFGLVDDFDVTERGATRVVLSPRLCATLAKQGRALDAGRYFALDRPTSRRLYRYLDHRRYRGAVAVPELVLNLRELAAELPVRRSNVAHIRRTLDPAHAELRAAGFLLAADYERHGRGLYTVRYRFGSGAAVSPSRPSPVADAVAELVELAVRELRDPASAAFYAGAVRDLGPDTFRVVLGSVREQLRDGLDLATARRFFVAAVKRRTTGAGQARPSPSR